MITKIRWTRFDWLWICLAAAMVSLACDNSSDSSENSVETITDNGIDLSEGFWSNGFGTQLFFASDGTWEHLDDPNPTNAQLVLTRGDFDLEGDDVMLSGTVVDEINPDFPAGENIACTGSVVLLMGGGADAELQLVCTLLHIDPMAEDNTLVHDL